MNPRHVQGVALLGLLPALLWTPLHAQHDRHHAPHVAAALPGQASPLPRESGQAAFAALQEAVALLEADPATDWNAVDLRALREHLVDMDALTLRASVDEKPLPGGFEALVTGEGRTGEAVRRMVAAHASMLDGYRGWRVAAEEAGQGMRLTVVSADPGEAAHIWGLGFFGVMASGAHHQEHHLRLAKGERMH